MIKNRNGTEWMATPQELYEYMGEYYSFHAPVSQKIKMEREKYQRLASKLQAEHVSVIASLQVECGKRDGHKWVDIVGEGRYCSICDLYDDESK